MTIEQAAVLLTVGVVLVVGVATGPAVTGMESATDSTPSDLHEPFVDTAGMSLERTAAFQVHDMPTTGGLRRVDGGYRPDVAPVRLSIEPGDTAVVVSYALSIPATGYSATRSRRIAGGSAEELQLQAPTEPVDGPLAVEGTYRASVSVELRSNGETYVVDREDLTLEVSE